MEVKCLQREETQDNGSLRRLSVPPEVSHGIRSICGVNRSREVVKARVV